MDLSIVLRPGGAADRTTVPKHTQAASLGLDRHVLSYIHPLIEQLLDKKEDGITVSSEALEGGQRTWKRGCWVQCLINQVGI